MEEVGARLERVDGFQTFKDALTTNPQLSVTAVREPDYYAAQSEVLHTIIRTVGFIVAGLMGIGAIFGAVLFLTLVPGTVFVNALRLAGAHPGDWPGTIGTLIVAAASGGFAGRILMRERRASRALAIATVVLTAAASGPVPVVNSARAAWLFIGFVPICVAAGTATTFARRIVWKDMS